MVVKSHLKSFLTDYLYGSNSKNLYIARLACHSHTVSTHDDYVCDIVTFYWCWEYTHMHYFVIQCSHCTLFQTSAEANSTQPFASQRESIAPTLKV